MSTRLQNSNTDTGTAILKTLALIQDVNEARNKPRTLPHDVWERSTPEQRRYFSQLATEQAEKARKTQKKESCD